ncbi:PREDICTED: zinc-finger homeodomain [Prunus dulcis]|uniref:PREDICTED: zinc-finger homeodomain n=1 Tax=Prunus dulcis TaxID=3755 RepID=A0A5E4EVS2_PRUDU|nr:zinc-finger homeodomain protein 11-like [Prunus dulcis]VVA19582.1 PREDICTED: zinc-finger homeodomain [Prunus dulcis]
MEGDHHDQNTNEVYRECLRNHAASLGSYATDGCGEFTLDDASPGGLQCAACGCHRNFHRRVAYAATSSQAAGGSGRSSGHHHHHHNRVIMSSSSRGRDPSDNTIATQDQLMDYNAGGGGSPDSGDRMSGKKRFRTKFTAEQKEKMLAFAEKLGWKLQRKDLEDEIERFCRSIGVSRQVFKVWMHNHKNLSSSSTSASTGNASSLTTQ